MSKDWSSYVGAELYASVGLALTQWQHVEIGLYHIFLRVTQMPNELIASAVFFSPPNFKDKLTMVDSAASFALAGTKHLDPWNTLSNKLGRKNRKRNELAHFMSLHYPEAESVLRPNLFDAKTAFYWHQKGQMPELTPNQLTERAQSFGRLAQKLEEFARGLKGLKLPLPDRFPSREDRPGRGKANKDGQSPKEHRGQRGPSRK